MLLAVAGDKSDPHVARQLGDDPPLDALENIGRLSMRQRQIVAPDRAALAGGKQLLRPSLALLVVV